ncbi:tRNA (N6-isopentenyl adenosine(37)-C2)-methylthiotransferase MiaB [Parvularcula dongshanensis]|uniref:tRNA-2-methylthio-N(6)-dimethylallyladenosine synthase n=1 Tax=Parvularcula dongshanensis TaxID=1173995 RepID=A0A840HZK6_9PROT|nr:tRNA (N6-isopentenyl adenosine(37)-C2)-methylthiotransferase MiaB [Parvularcula dongshanensis]MBB4658009.1 tRNA-2-methylthio-N6-dimethylallyladenosine synthase [Parvularcula dongshanensis]
MTTTSSTLADATAPAPKRVHFKTWGCQMNAYDTERMAGLLRPLGYAVTEEASQADLLILNTCHIREKAAEKVYSELGRLKAQRKPGSKLAVAGCVAQAEGAEITARAPQVDLVIGPQSYHRLPELIARSAREAGEVLHTEFEAEAKFDALEGERPAPGVSAFVTVQEGCDKFCTFCVVPYTRGAEVGRATDRIVSEVRALAAQGVREVTLLGQNVNAWRGAPPAGIGGEAWGLGQLCRHLALIDGIERIRFTTSHPNDMDDALIRAFAEEPKLMPYLHLPVQSGSTKILKAMNRRHTAEDYLRLIERIRAARPDIAISGDFIVGFPGEDEAAFEETMRLTREVGYAACFSFKYSRRPGTPGATMPKQVAEDAKAERLARLQALLDQQRLDFNRAQIGRTLPVLFEAEGRHEGQLKGRSPYLQAVHADAPATLIGQIAAVEIDAAAQMSLSGRLSVVAAA